VHISWSAAQSAPAGPFCADALAPDLWPAVSQGKPGISRAPALTPEERGLLEGLARGLSQEQLAAEAGVSRRAIEKRIAALKERCGVHTLFESGMVAARLRD